MELNKGEQSSCRQYSLIKTMSKDKTALIGFSYVIIAFSHQMRLNLEHNSDTRKLGKKNSQVFSGADVTLGPRFTYVDTYIECSLSC